MRQQETLIENAPKLIQGSVICATDAKARNDLEMAGKTKSDLADPKLAPHNVWLKEDSSLLSDPYEDSDARYETDRQWERQQVFSPSKTLSIAIE